MGLSRECNEARAEKLDKRLSRIENGLAKIPPVNKCKVFENAMRVCKEKMVEQVTDQGVGHVSWVLFCQLTVLHQ